jgi:hypothetical protein
MTMQHSSSHPPEQADGRARRSAGDVLVRSLGSWRFWLPSAAVFVVFAAIFFQSSAPFSISEVESVCGQAPPDVQAFTTGDDVSGFLDACGAEGRAAYRNMQIADLFYPAVYGLFIASSLALSLARTPLSSRWVSRTVALAFVGAGFDYVENIFAWIALATFPGDASTNSLVGLAGTAKTATYWISGLVLIGTLVVLVARRFRRMIGAREADRHQGDIIGHRSSVHLDAGAPQ